MSNKYMFAFILNFILLGIPLSALSQTKAAPKTDLDYKTVQRIKRYPHLYWGFFGGYNMLEITASNPDVRYSNTASPTGGFFLELRINKWFGLETGGNYLMFYGDASFISSSYLTTIIGLSDSDGDSYSATYAASDVLENWDASYLEIPLAIKLQLMAGKWTFYLKSGLSYNLLLNSSYQQNGVYSRAGYYPGYNISFDDLPTHGFYEEQIHSSAGIAAFNNYLQPFLGFGIVLPAKSGNLFLDARYCHGVNSMVQPGNGTLFEGPENLAPLPYDFQFESISQESGKLSTKGFIFCVGFRF